MNTPSSSIESRLNADGLELSFTGCDQDALDAVDMDNFVRNIQVANEPRSYPFALPTFALAVLYLLAIPIIDAAFPGAGGFHAFALLIFLAIFNLVGLVIMERRKKSPPQQRFTLRMDRELFTFRGEQGAERAVPLRDVIAFESGRRLSIIMGNGARVVLPCVRMPSDVRDVTDPHAQVASLLNGDLGRLRSARVGYRGEELVLGASGKSGEERSDERAGLERGVR